MEHTALSKSKDSLNFPDNFIWGTSTGGHQVEGGNEFSDWWVWEQKGLIEDGTVSGRAMDYWNRHEEDHALMEKLQYQGFRLGIEWSRVEPQKGCFDREVIEHYRRILQSLRDHRFTIYPEAKMFSHESTRTELGSTNIEQRSGNFLE